MFHTFGDKWCVQIITDVLNTENSSSNILKILMLFKKTQVFMLRHPLCVVYRVSQEEWTRECSLC